MMTPQGKAPSAIQKNEGTKPEGKAATGGVESQTPREREKGESRMMTPQGKAPSAIQKNEGTKPEGKAATEGVAVANPKGARKR